LIYHAQHASVQLHYLAVPAPLDSLSLSTLLVHVRIVVMSVPVATGPLGQIVLLAIPHKYSASPLAATSHVKLVVVQIVIIV
jgi:hypothetical protein